VTSELQYGSADFTGYNVTDTVCITPGDCAQNFEFFVIDDYESSTEINGILGLGPIGNEDLVGPNIIQYLDE
jgi:hypothetical protein